MSDTMCAKTTETSRCQRCGSEFDWLSDGTKVHAGKRYFESDSLLCLERQLNSANERIKRLEEVIQERDKEWFQVIESILGFHPVSMTEALHIGIERIKKQKQRIKRLEEAGDKAILNSYLPDRIAMWNKAKEDKL